MAKKFVRRPRVDVNLSYPNHGTRPKRYVVLHQTISPDYNGLKDIQGVGDYLKHVGYAIHCIVDKDGNSAAVSVAQEQDIYWHCQGLNTNSIGIEQISYKTGEKGYWWKRPKQLHKVARWLAYYSKQHGIVLQYDPLLVLGSGIVGHADVTKAYGISGGHTDCQYPNYPTKLVIKLAKTYKRFGWF